MYYVDMFNSLIPEFYMFKSIFKLLPNLFTKNNIRKHIIRFGSYRNYKFVRLLAWQPFQLYG